MLQIGRRWFHCWRYSANAVRLANTTGTLLHRPNYHNPCNAYPCAHKSSEHPIEHIMHMVFGQRHSRTRASEKKFSVHIHIFRGVSACAGHHCALGNTSKDPPKKLVEFVPANIVSTFHSCTCSRLIIAAHRLSLCLSGLWILFEKSFQYHPSTSEQCLQQFRWIPDICSVISHFSACHCARLHSREYLISLHTPHCMVALLVCTAGRLKN